MNFTSSDTSSDSESDECTVDPFEYAESIGNHTKSKINNYYHCFMNFHNLLVYSIQILLIS